MAYIGHREGIIGGHEVVVLEVRGEVELRPRAPRVADHRRPRPGAHRHAPHRRRGDVAVADDPHVEPLADLLHEIPRRNLLRKLAHDPETDAFASALKIRKNDSDTAYEYFMSLLGRERIMERRLGIVSLMKNRKLFADKKSEILEAITASDSDEYYISMAVAWALTSFIMDDRDNEAWLEKLSDATRQKTKQKIRDSERERKKK